VGRVVTEAVVRGDQVASVLEPRTAGVCEVVAGPPSATGSGGTLHRFSLERGPYHHYSRTVEVTWLDGSGRSDKAQVEDGSGRSDKAQVEDGSGLPESSTNSTQQPGGDLSKSAETSALVRQEVDYELIAPFFKWLIDLPIRLELGRLVPPRRRAWWLPPDTLDERSMRVLCVLGILAFVSGYQNGLMPQTLTYAVKAFHATNFDQSVVIAASRIDALVALVLMVLADRVGRRKVLVSTVLWGAVFSALGALSPSLAWLGVSQTVARSLVATQVALITIYAAEEMPAGSRAYSLGILTAVGVLGQGINVMLLGGVNVYGWRAIFALALLGCAVVPAASRMLPESKRFSSAPRRLRGPGAPRLRDHSERLMLILALGFLIQAFALPTSQFLNQFLRTERGYSAPHIVLYNVFTTIPGALGLFGGGRLADRYGRKVVAGFAMVVGSAAMVGGYLTWGWEMWAFHMVAQVLAGALIPATAILGPEIFPTTLRATAFGAFTVSQSVGSVLGLLVVGLLSEPAYFGKLGIPIAIVSAGPFLMALILLRWFPETAHRELEEINPEDRPPPPEPGGDRGSP
jgi:MFS family permease